MSNVAHTIDQLIEAVGPTYQAIDIRSVAIRKDDSWLNVLAAVRFTYEDVETAKARLAKLSKRHTPVQTDLLRIDSCVRAFAEWPDMRSELVSKSLLRIGELEFQLRQRPDFNQPGYIQAGYSRLRPFDGRNWPAVSRDFDVGGNHPLIDGYGQFNRVAQLLGYADAFDAANTLCQVNVSLGQDRGCDLSFSFPVFADISATRIDTREKRINVEIKRHRAYSDIKIMACVRGPSVLVDAPFREQITLSEVSMNEPQDEIVSARGFAQCHDLDPDNDWLEVRLVHPRLGQVKSNSNYARMFIPPSERNILLGAVRQFCKGTALDDLLTRAYNVQATKLKTSAAFELHVSWLLGMFGLSTVVLGEYESLLAPDTPVQRVSIDILAADQRSRLLLLIGCTLNPPKEEDIGNLRSAREIFAREVFAGTGVQVIPVLFTSAMGCPFYYQSEGHFDSVAVIDADRMKTLLGFLDSGQESRFFQFLGNPTLGLTPSSQPGRT